jgi:O-antigen ligase
MLPRDPDQLLLLLAGALVVVGGTVLVRHRRMVGVVALLVVQLLSVAGVAPALTAGGLSLYPSDIVLVVLALVVLVTPRPYTPGRRALLVLVALAVFATLRGLAAFDLQTAGNSARAFLSTLVPWAFGMWCLEAHRPEGLERLARAWRWAALFLMGSAVVYFARNGLGTYSTSGDRALNSPQTLVVASAALMSLMFTRGRGAAWFAMAAFAIVLASQQRTVWAATLAGMAGFVLATRRSANTDRRSAVRMLVGGATAATVVLLVAAPSDLRRSLSESTSSISTDSGTFGWRVDGWLDLLDTYSDTPLFDQTVGSPAGSGFGRTVFGREITVSPHNMYLTVLISLGALGLAALIVAYLTAFRRTRRGPARGLIWFITVYSIGYQIDPSLALLLGALLASSLPAEPVEVKETTQPAVVSA